MDKREIFYLLKEYIDKNKFSKAKPNFYRKLNEKKLNSFLLNVYKTYSDFDDGILQFFEYECNKALLMKNEIVNYIVNLIAKKEMIRIKTQDVIDFLGDSFIYNNGEELGNYIKNYEAEITFKTNKKVVFTQQKKSFITFYKNMDYYIYQALKLDEGFFNNNVTLKIKLNLYDFLKENNINIINGVLSNGKEKITIKENIYIYTTNLIEYFKKIKIKRKSVNLDKFKPRVIQLEDYERD